MHRDGATYVPGTLESIRFLRFELEFAQQETGVAAPAARACDRKLIERGAN
jgi:hypothetical protein